MAKTTAPNRQKRSTDLKTADTYQLLKELSSRIRYILRNKQCLSEQYIDKAKQLLSAINDIKVHH